jgi:hypothetical protein
MSSETASVLALGRQTTFLLSLGFLIGASAVVSVCGWILFARDRRAHRAAVALDAHHHEATEER